MNEQEFARTLKAVSMRCFIAYFRQICNPSISDEDVAALLKEGGYADRTCLARARGARRIINAGRGRDALTTIANSRADAWTRQEATRFLTSRG